MDIRKILSILLLGPGIAGAAEVLYVSPAAAPEGADGRAWESAFACLQQAIDNAPTNAPVEIWLQRGKYRPTGAGRDAAFRLRSGMALYGGFRGTETRRDQRRPRANRTILSGDIGRIGTPTDNCRHVVTAETGGRLDSLIIQAGHNENGKGAGLLVAPHAAELTVANCTFEKNHADRGGAIYMQAASVNLSNCTFYANTARAGGALFAAPHSRLRTRHTIFSANHAAATGGALHLAKQTDTGLLDTSFFSNSADTYGGALAAVARQTNGTLLAGLQRCTFSDNTADISGGAMHAAGDCSPVVADCTFDGNAAQDKQGSLSALNGAFYMLSQSRFTLGRGQLTDGGHSNIRVDVNPRQLDMNYFSALPTADTPPLVLPDTHPVGLAVLNPKPIRTAKKERTLTDRPLFDEDGTPLRLSELTGAADCTVFTFGDLTDPDFIRSYRNVEAAARDYAVGGAAFYYIYRALTHPENHDFIQPFTAAERARHVNRINELLPGSIPWLYDTMTNGVLSSMVHRDGSDIYLYNREGREEYRGGISNAKGLRKALARLTGNAAAKTNPELLQQPALSPLGRSRLTEQVKTKIDPAYNPHYPLRLLPTDLSIVHCIKPRIEADKGLLESGNGTLYLGFHVDPLYKVEWNPLDDPVKYLLKLPEGCVANPSVGKGRRSGSVIVSDTAPREFIVEVRNLKPGQELRLQAAFSVRIPGRNKLLNYNAEFKVLLEQDRFGGAVFGRQVKPPRLGGRLNSSKRAGGFERLLRRFDLNLDRQISRDEAFGRIQQQFDQVDTNRDGQVDEKEYAVFQF